MPTGTRRLQTETHAWCCGCEQMVLRDCFNKGQARCRDCQRAVSRNRYSKGRICSECSGRISDYAPRDICRTCSRRRIRESTPSRRELNPRNYVVITSHRDHPNADMRGRIYEHVLVMSEKLGRPLVPGENVHHINGVRDDNRPQNLELWSTAQPKGQRVSDKVAWAKEILALYAPESLTTALRTTTSE